MITITPWPARIISENGGKNGVERKKGVEYSTPFSISAGTPLKGVDKKAPGSHDPGA
jgi:hypothetical protein